MLRTPILGAVNYLREDDILFKHVHVCVYDVLYWNILIIKSMIYL